MSIAIPVDAVVFDDSFYPRGSFDQETVNRYRQAMDNLPPIQVTHENVLIDGYHRLIAHRIEQREVIAADVEHLERGDVLWEATKRNAAHGLQLSLKDKKRLARAFFNANGRTQADIADVLSVNASSISRWVRDLKVEQDKERDEKIWQMWLACCTQEEIAGAIGLDQSSIAKLLADMKKLHLQEIHIPDSLQIFNLWRFQNNDDRYGMDYPGRIPGQIVENVLHYYTEPFDTVIDPMAGSGTTADVCKGMARRWRAYDIAPVRDDIKQHNAIYSLPPECNGCNLVFLDPPYWQQKKGEYSADETNLANFPLPQFYEAIGQIFFHCHSVLSPGGYMAIIIGPTQSQGIVYDHAFEFNTRALEIGFDRIIRIIVPYTTQQAKPYHVTDAKEGRYMLKLYRDLLVYRKAC